MPDEVKNDQVVYNRYCKDADRIVIAKVQTARYEKSTVEQVTNNWPTYYTTATLSVERSATALAAPQVSSLDIRIPGGMVGGTGASASGYPLMKIGQRYLLVLAYPEGTPYTTVTPFLLRWLEIPPNFHLPSNKRLNKALQEYCNGY